MSMIHPNPDGSRPVTPPGFLDVQHTYWIRVPLPPDDLEEDLPEDDGVPLESDWHRLQMNLLIDTVTQHMGPREDYFTGGNMFLYYSPDQRKNNDFRGPDFFFVKGVPLKKKRRYYAIWREDNHAPNVIIELGSPTTLKTDRTEKKRIYQNIVHAPNYYIYDPDSETLEGYRLEEGFYEPLKPNEKGWLWCEELELWLGKWEGKFQGKRYVYLRWFDPDGRLIPTLEEAQRQKAEAERKKAETERKKAEAERQKAEAERKKAETERQRAEAAEKELQRLRAILDQKAHPSRDNGPDTANGNS